MQWQSFWQSLFIVSGCGGVGFQQNVWPLQQMVVKETMAES